MTLDECLAKITASQPADKIDLSLSRMIKALEYFSLDKFNATTIKVAGTNGKGSTIAALNQIYTSDNYKVACYTSPHLLQFNERLKINNKIIEDNEWIEAFNSLDHIASELSLTYFENITLAAFLIIKKYDIDIVLLEIGLGGRLDAVNAINADMAIITSIGYDHMDRLGNSLTKIAYEKAGIISEGIDVIFTGNCESDVIKKQANIHKCRTFIINEDFSYESDGLSWCYKSDTKKHYLPCVPNIHPDVACGVLKVIEILRDKYSIQEININNNIINVKQLGRCQVINAKVPIVIDVSHNLPAVEYLVSFIKKKYPKSFVHAIFGCLATKDYTSILKEFNILNTSINIAPVCAEQSLSNDCFPGYNTYSSLTEAFNDAYSKAKDDDIIVAFGSFYVVSELLHSLTMIEKEVNIKA